MMLPKLYGLAYLLITIGLGVVLLFVSNKLLDRHPRQKLVRAVGWISLALTVAGGLVYFIAGTEVIRVFHPPTSKVEVASEKYMMFGSQKVKAGDAEVELTSSRSSTWIINETKDVMAAVEVRVYGSADPDAPAEVTIRPESAVLFGGKVTNVGPDDSPGSSVSSKASSAVRSWLNWGPTAGSIDDLGASPPND